MSKKQLSNEHEAKLVQDNLGLVFRHVRKFCTKQNNLSDVDDYFQAGSIGLLKAIRKHDPNRGQLSTIAWICILQEIIKEHRKCKLKTCISIDDLDKLIEDKPNNKILEDFLPKISEEEYNILLYRTMNMSFREISECMGKSINTIKSIYNKTKNKIIEKNK